MNSNHILEYITVAVVVLVFILKAKGMKKYVPTALFSIIYANIWCLIADYFKLWNYPTRFAPSTFVSISFNYIILPILVMFWLRYIPVNTAYRVAWAFGWTIIFILGEFILTRYTNILKYTNGYDIHISFILWMISWYIFFKFHCWITYTKYLES